MKWITGHNGRSEPFTAGFLPGNPVYRAYGVYTEEPTLIAVPIDQQDEDAAYRRSEQNTQQTRGEL